MWLTGLFRGLRLWGLLGRLYNVWNSKHPSAPTHKYIRGLAVLHGPGTSCVLIVLHAAHRVRQSAEGDADGTLLRRSMMPAFAMGGANDLAHFIQIEAWRGGAGFLAHIERHETAL